MLATIRAATPADAQELVRLNDAFNGPGVCVEAASASLAKSAGEIVYVAEQEGRLVGFCCGQITHTFCEEHAQGEVTELYVEAAHRRTGVATALLLAIERHMAAQGVCAAKLLTGDDNYAAQALYRALGYDRSTEIEYEKTL